ncbi:hypothetical protein D0T50_11355 [Bacteroides sp. 214]|nr:hypothetical protein [Bacteroides sp. 214]
MKSNKKKVVFSLFSINSPPQLFLNRGSGTFAMQKKTVVSLLMVDGICAYGRRVVRLWTTDRETMDDGS